ncbi:MAG TPA: AAA family ATPase, partial [Ktedonobacterales bacterium]|nr:AAA family ATPase [Ktedonobacterales bacterium]
MAYLKRLELHGFKSFAQRCALEFSPGVTAIVGPNGSGKCTSGDALVTLSDGSEVEIRDLVENALHNTHAIERLDDGIVAHGNPRNVQVLSLNPMTFQIEARPVLAFVKRKAPPHLLHIQTRSGREIKVTPYHPLFTLEHGQLKALQAGGVSTGIRIALPRQLPIAQRQVQFAFSDVMELFHDDDKMEIPVSVEVRQWAETARSEFGTWQKWASAAKITDSQLNLLLRGPSVSITMLKQLAQIAKTPLPLNGSFKKRLSKPI